MGSVTDSWTASLTIDTTDHKSTVSATVTLTLTCEHTPPHSLNGAAMLKIGCTYYNANNDPIGMDGNPLPAGATYSKYDVIASMGGSGNPTVITVTRSEHDGAAYCRASPPAGATKALYKYYAASNANTICPGAAWASKPGPSSPAAVPIFVRLAVNGQGVGECQDRLSFGSALARLQLHELDMGYVRTLSQRPKRQPASFALLGKPGAKRHFSDCRGKRQHVVSSPYSSPSVHQSYRHYCLILMYRNLARVVGMMYHSPMTLTELRDAKKLSVREVARRMGASHITVMDIERGSDPKISTLEKYANALGVSLGDVLAARKLGMV